MTVEHQNGMSRKVTHNVIIEMQSDKIKQVLLDYVREHHADISHRATVMLASAYDGTIYATIKEDYIK